MLTAKDSDTLAATVVNNTGIIEANSTDVRNGSIFLLGGEHGKVSNTGTLSAPGVDSGTQGGTIHMEGDVVRIGAGGIVDVSGDAGAGSIYMYGSHTHGPGEPASMTVAGGARIYADAVSAGYGGGVFIGAVGDLDFSGSISARGGNGGQGGNASLSAQSGFLSVKGPADLTATSGGTNGELSLSSPSFTIAATGGNMTGALLGQQLDLARVSITATGAGTDGTINVNQDVSWTSSNNLCMIADKDIYINADLYPGGYPWIVLHADTDGNSAGTVNFNSGSITFGGGTGNVEIWYNPPGSFDDPIDYSHQTDYPSFVINGTVTAHMLVNDVEHLQAMKTNLAGDYYVGRDIDASATASWNYDSDMHRYQGFEPVGTTGEGADTPFTGRFDGGEHTISGLTINRPDTDNVGLFGATSGAYINNVSFEGGSITGHDYVGGIVGISYDSSSIYASNNRGTVTGNSYVGGLTGLLDGGVIEDSYNTGNITGSSYVGGLTGSFSSGWITGSHNDGNVTGTGDYVGGLAGDPGIFSTCDTSYNTGEVSGHSYVGGAFGYVNGEQIIDQVYNTGTVTGSGDNVGGIAGYYYGLGISSSYNTGLITGNSNVGGIAGSMAYGGIADSYNTGTVSGSSSGGMVGGLAGELWGTLTRSYNTGLVTGDDGVGGLAGVVYGSMSDSFNMGPVHGSVFVGGLAGDMELSGSISTSYNTAMVTGATLVDALVGSIGTGSGTVSNCYFDISTTGIDTSPHGTGLETSSLMSRGTFAGWNFTSTWGIIEGTSYPYLQWQGTPQVVSGMLTPAAGGKAIEAVVDGTSLGRSYTGENGFFYFALPAGSVTIHSNLLTYISGDTHVSGDYPRGASVYLGTGSHMLGLSIDANTLQVDSEESNSGLGMAKGGLTSPDILYSLSGSDLTVADDINFVTCPRGGESEYFVDGNITTGGTGTQTYNGMTWLTAEDTTVVLTSTAGITFNQSVNGVGYTLILDSNRTVTNYWTDGEGGNTWAPITVDALLLRGAGGNYQLADVDNHVGTLAADTGTVNFLNFEDLTIGSVGGVNGITTSSQTTVLVHYGDIYLDRKVTANASVSGDPSIRLAASGNFFNNVGADALNPGTGVWWVYSNDPPLDYPTPNGLTPDFIQFGTIFPPTPPQGGNGFFYAYQPLIDVSLSGTVTKIYDGTDAAHLNQSNYSSTGAMPGDLVNLDVSASGYYFTDKNVGTNKEVYVTLPDDGQEHVVISGVTNGGIQVYGYILNSYSLSGNIGTITPAPLTITGGTAENKVYDATTTAVISGVTFSNIFGSDDVSAGTVGFFADKNVGTGKPVTPVLYGADAGNYQLLPSTTLAADITPRDLIISAVSDTKTYDATTASIAVPTLSGRQDSDSISGLSEVFDSKNAGDRTLSVAGGYYTIDDGNNGRNYNVQLATAPGTINPAPLGVTADNLNKQEGSTDPALTWKITAGQLFGEDSLTGNLVRIAGESVGPYPISLGTLGNNNYLITYVGGNLTITSVSGGSTDILAARIAAITPEVPLTDETSTTTGQDTTVGANATHFSSWDTLLASDFEAFYRDSVDQQLQRAASAQNTGDQEVNLLKAQNEVETLRTAELKDYFKDNRLDVGRTFGTPPDTVLQNTAVIYPVLFEDHTELVVKLPTGLKRYSVPVGKAAMSLEINAFRRDLEKITSREYLPHAERLYDWLIRPFEADLKKTSAHTLVFVPDGALRTVPMEALNDGRDFLISHYAVAVVPALKLTDTHPVERKDINMVEFGLTEAVQGYPSLPFVGDEIADIQKVYGSPSLMNEDFNLASVERHLAGKGCSIVHIASHGHFDRDVGKSFLLTFDNKLTMDRLDQDMRELKAQGKPLELLTLSACNTAIGDDRAALGLTGVAVKAGVRSAVGSLWHVNDRSSAILMEDFYRQLQNPLISKAVALQRAKLKLLHDKRYRHPSYWAPFLLIGNWT